MKLRRMCITGGAALALLLPGLGVGADASMLELANARGCFVCHSVVADGDTASLPLAPSYQEVALRYRDDSSAFDKLVDRVLHGTAYREQDWAGKVSMRFMPPNVNVSRQEAGALVHWILDLQVDEATAEKLQHHDKMLALASYSGCLICHHVDPLKDPSVVPLAPAFREVAAQYADQPEAKQRLVDTILHGTMDRQGKTWENVNMRFMPPSVNVREDDAVTLVDWILSLDPQGAHARPVEPKHP